MERAVTIPIGIVVARQRIEHPWSDVRWRPVEALLDPPASAEWREIKRGPGFVHYLAATMPLSLDPKQAMAYRVNLANGVPSIYVVMRHIPGASADVPIFLHHVSVSPFLAESYLETHDLAVERVAMPEKLVHRVEEFLAMLGPRNEAGAFTPQRMDFT